MTISNPRRAAFDILSRIERERSYADILLDQALSKGSLTGPDRGLLTELVYGVLRRRGTLDHIIGQFSRQKVEKLERSVLTLLRLGLYQAFYLDRIPVSAAVNETVELAKSLAPRSAGFINAVLRRADRERESIGYPDRERDPVGFLAARFSHPAWIVRGWIEQLGMDEAELLSRVMGDPSPLTIRVNTLKTTREELAAKLAAEGITAEPAGYSPHGLRILTPIHVAKLTPFQEGLFTVQDESSQLASLFLAPLPGEQVLDLCAAPGGKATHLAQLMGNKGSVLACDIGERKLRLISESAARLGISIIAVKHLDASRPLALEEGVRFDRILVDAPCSGLGVIRRNPEGKWWKSAADVAELSRKQKDILKNAAGFLAPGGTILYATCSTSREENEGVIDDFLSQGNDFVLENLRMAFPALAPLFTDRGFFRSWPHRHGMDGFFAARLRRIKS